MNNKNNLISLLMLGAMAIMVFGIVISLFSEGLEPSGTTAANIDQPPTAANFAADQSTTSPSTKPITIATLAAASPQPKAKPQAQDDQIECIERWDRAAIGSQTTYGYQQAQADGLVYSYGIFGAGTQDDPFKIMVYTNCLHVAQENQK